jgi:hypothetical protein
MNNSVQNDSTLKFHALLNDLGHEIKNKLGILGSSLKDLSLGLILDKDSIEDSLNVYNQLLLLSQVLTTSSIFNISNKENNYIFDYLESIFKIIISHKNLNKLGLPTSNIIFKFTCIDSNINKTINLKVLDENLKNSDDILTFLNKPKNSIDIIYKKIIDLALLESREKSIKISIFKEESKELIEEHILN